MTGSIQVVAHEVRRLTIPSLATFADFRERYENAVPVFDAARFEEFKRIGADWDTVLRATAENAPYEFIRYWGTDVGSLMRLAGDWLPCAEYLMGNHTIAQRMYRHDPAVMLYAPLRTAIHEDRDGRSWFSVDQPSTRFGSFDNPQIAAVGLELDGELARLLTHLELPVPTELTADGRTTERTNS
ncbi:MAG: hypothetical protein JWQ81_1399 [Amycolatopsis sp.]|uniref:DUF302 domain-containing protein n=1 Tax=Amycolatopsis sp. TaxID=37632 RepID=UPI0026110EC8|nr:DUF302 domain-containing protein [Amycolatopsis sp.]MCU1680660.1 hypothetical protein [Amycolatopsis sp.]